jgi:antitoxin (DNA-binding transcriptional repressor) of toxin-antitoxin stability system
MPTVTIKELHARTGAWVRKAGKTPVQVTDHGKPVAMLTALPRAGEVALPVRKRVLLPQYTAYLKRTAAQRGTETVLADLDAIREERC